jgi:glycosyltransferase involved in cell wall biosynthesis
MEKEHLKKLKVLYVAPSSLTKTGVAGYSNIFSNMMEVEKGDVSVEMERFPLSGKTGASFCLKTLKREVQDFRFSHDVVHAEMSSSSYLEFWLLFFLMREHSHTSFFVTVHDSPYLCLNPFLAFQFFANTGSRVCSFVRKMLDHSVGRIIERLMFNNLSGIFVMTRKGSNILERRLGGRVATAYLPHVPFPRPQQRGSSGQHAPSGKQVLFYGFIRKSKGLEVLIRAFKKVITEGPDKDNITLFLCGGYSEKGRYLLSIRGLIKSLGIEESVRILGYREDAYVDEMLTNASCVVFPYQNKKTYSSSAALLRALSAGSASIVSDIPMLTEYVKDGWNGLVFRENDCDDLAEKLRIMMRTPDLGRKLGRNALEYVSKEHDTIRIREIVLREYLKCLHGVAGR